MLEYGRSSSVRKCSARKGVVLEEDKDCAGEVKNPLCGNIQIPYTISIEVKLSQEGIMDRVLEYGSSLVWPVVVVPENIYCP